MHRRILIAVENNRWHWPHADAESISILRHYLAAHGAEGRWQILSRTAGEARMHADRRVKLRIGLSHDGRCRAARRQTSHVYAAWIDVVILHDLPGYASNQCRLAL